MTTEPARRSWKASALASAGCSLLFLVVYSTTNALAATRDDVGRFCWEWEAQLPLVPWLIIPYMSIDAFFVAAPFVCADVREIKMLAKRICTAIVVAGIFFVAWPLELCFPRPQVDGFLGSIFGFLHGFDKPYNLFPSLHITLIFILRWTYHRHVRGRWRLLMHLWFALVTASTLFTHQHQVIDLIGGLALAVLIFYVFPTGLITRKDATVTRAPGPRAALFHLIGTVVFALLAWWSSAWSWWAFWLLVWLATALLLIGLGYGGLGPRVYRKYAGYLSIPSRILLWPYLFPLWLSRLLLWSREQGTHVPVDPRVSFGRLPDKNLAQQLQKEGVTAVLDLCGEHSELPQLRRLHYLNLPIMDMTWPEASLLDRAVEFLEAELQRGRVYVHCALGYERSAIVVGSWLLRTGRAADLDAAISAVRARSNKVPERRVRAALAALR